MSPIEVLRQASDLEPLGAAALEKLCVLCREDRFQSQEVVFREGQDADRLYLLAEGTVALQVKVGEFQNVVVGTFSRQGELFGWSAVLPGKHYTASAKCLKASGALSIERSRLEGLFSDDPALGFQFMKIIAGLIDRRLSATRRRLISSIS